METLNLLKDAAMCAAVLSILVFGLVLCLCKAAAIGDRYEFDDDVDDAVVDDELEAQ